MSRALAKKEIFMTVEEYLVFEEKSKRKHEFMDGEIFQMAGVKRNHSLIGSNVTTDLNIALRDKPCEVHGSDIKVMIREGHYVYPDVSVVCDEIDFDKNSTTLLNPIVIFEVLSKSTESRDRGEKAEDYFKLASLRDYVMIAQNRVRVEHYSRIGGGKWTFEVLESLDDKLILDSIDCKIPLKNIYSKVELKPLKLIKKKK
ncbi:MAG TPA: Uma2 family endonuclease [Pyrinomonadaceae bacterium]|nr:Uma2 family endonuclease [Pyrinomonadaceae bacterium]